MVHAAWGVHWRHRRRGLDRYSNLSVAISRNVSWIMNYFKHSLDTGPFRHRLWCLSDCQQEQTYWRFFFSRPMLNFVSFFLINILFPNSAGCWLALEHDITLLFYWFISSSFVRPCGRLSWLPVSFSPRVKYTVGPIISYRMTKAN